ncbi:MAG TPA: AAA family ATPase, partial [Acidimicrobiales bacterium]|nr:AAA family ATPase [Acidimicrobiales bacterium]
MYLKALTLKGFKSFAEPATLELQDGVTVVVGPNGSGKSNVVDAIGWVLGAQAPSAVRSGKMEDVIFAGTDKRSALGRAEVTLTIDNGSGRIPVEFSEVTVTRTLWRSGESEYAINGVACRLLDVQDLFSDTGVGRQQHVIVGQGQIDAVLNARPEERRLVIEEAAGVLKHRKRKERSERRLAATEGNLLRLGDLVREVRRQLRPLEKQADAARRHDDLVAELRALRVFVTGRELSTLKRRLGDTTAARAEARNEEALLKRRLSELDVAVMADEAKLGQLGGSDLGDALGRYEALREKARGQLALMAERRRGIERERAAFIDQGVIASLEADAARLQEDIAEVESEAAGLEPAGAALVEAETGLADARSAFEAEWAGGVPAPSGRTAEVRGELGALRTAMGRSAGDDQRSQSRLTNLRGRLQRIEFDAADAGEQVAAAEAQVDALAAALAAARSERSATESALAEAEGRRDETAAERATWAARVEALTLALDEARSRAGAERLAGVDGVRGTLLELVDIDPGWEAAAEAACGEALAAVVVDSVAAGRHALSVLAEGDVAGGVLALGAGSPSGAAGAIAAAGAGGPGGPAGAPPPVGEPVRPHVRPHSPEVGPLLDALLARAVAVDGPWEQALDAALAHPDAVVVTRSGGRFGLTGWRVVTATTGATGAALDEAVARAADAADAAEAAATAYRAAREAADAARRTAGAAGRAVDDNDRALAAARAAAERYASQREDTTAELAALAEEQGDAADRLARDRARIAELEALLPELEAEDEALAGRARAMAEARRRLDERASTVGQMRTELQRRRAGIEDRSAFLARRLAEVEQRLAGSVE